MLLLHRANPNLQDVDGNTPVHLLSANGFHEALQVVLAHKPDLTLKNGCGETALDVAGTVKVKGLLQNSLKDQRSVDPGGYTRTEIGDCLIHDNRVDMVKGILFKSRLLTSQASQGQPAKPQPSDTSAPPKNPPRKSRRQALLEAVKTISAADEDSKEKRGVQKTVTAKDFWVVQELGKGSFGKVYLVKHKPRENLYALKVLEKKRAMATNLVRYTLAERNVLSRTQHPFIVRLHAAFQSSTKLFLVLQYCPGYGARSRRSGDLSRLQSKEKTKKFTEDRARIYAAEVLLALEYLHKRDIIFRDLKPENVVLDAAGHALLTDFGLSKEGATDDVITKSFCGSIAYIAPEVLNRTGHCKTVDWYLFGVLIHEMLIGLPPYYARTQTEIFEAVKTAPLVLPEYLSPSAKDLIARLLVRNPKMRLGAGKGDAEQIKKHPWFEGIDWQLVYNRGLNPPKPPPKVIPLQMLNLDILESDVAEAQSVGNWSFLGDMNS